MNSNIESDTPYCINTISVDSNGVFIGGIPLRHSFSLLSLQLILVVIISRFLYFVLRPLRQPRIISEILGGIIVGPSVLGRSAAFRKAAFPVRGKTVLDTMATFGVMYVFFVIGVKTDPSLIRRAGKKAAIIALVGVLLPYPAMMLTVYLLKHYLSVSLGDAFHVSVITSFQSITAFPVTIPILSEFHFLNSEIGLLATSSSIVCGICWWITICIYVILHASIHSPLRSLGAFLSLLALVVFILCVFRPLTKWIIRKTPEGKPVAEVYIFIILAGVLVIGFFSEMVGANSFNGALVMGLVIPDGPPLGSTLVEKLDSVLSELFLPLFYAMSGLKTDVFAIRDMKQLMALLMIVIVGLLMKIVGTLLPSLYFKMPFRDAISLGLIMCVKGQVEVLTYNYWWDAKHLNNQSFAVLVLSAVATTAIVTPLFTFLYNPSDRYMANQRRTMFHLKPGSEVSILTCIHHQHNVPTIINLLEATYATKESPLAVYAIRHVQLVGRAAPLFIPHKFARNTSSASASTSGGGSVKGGSQVDPIINAFHIYEQRNEESVSVHSFTAVAPYTTVHDEICQLALNKGVILIIIPFHKQTLDGYIEINHGALIMNRNIIHNAPCSVGLLVDRTIGGSLCTLVGNFSYHLACLFFGGDDDREALAYVSRMSQHPHVRITAIRFLSYGSAIDRSRERKLDNDLFEEFKAKNIGNQRVVQREVMVRDMEQIVTVIRSLDIDSFDLFVVGKHHENNLLLSKLVSSWTEFPELGVVGDLLASPDFGSTTSILVIQQQINVRLHVPGLPNSLTMAGREDTIRNSTIRHQSSPSRRSPRRIQEGDASVRFPSSQA
ncbi:cation/H(+) antiporter 15-like [Aristolochia californica]|uniref:cation/H(+) antiporter 15-like n=1 Tax=Aristolochia californica TaxID=171875 RepID=UPI0035DE1877